MEIVGSAEFGGGSVFGTGRERSWVTLRLAAAQQPMEAGQLFVRLLENVRLTSVYHSIYGDEFRANLPPR